MARPRPVPVESGRASTRANSSKIRSRFRFGHAWPVVGDAHHDAGRVPGRARRHQDLGAGGREPQCVLEQVAEDLFHHLDVDVEILEVDGHVEADAMRACERSEPADRRLREVAYVDRLAPDLEPACPDAAELEDVGDEALEAVGLVVDGVEELGTVAGIELQVGGAECRGRGADRGQRGAQVVGHRREKAGSGAADLGCHPGITRFRLEAEAVDGGGQPRDERLEQRRGRPNRTGARVRR